VPANNAYFPLSPLLKRVLSAPLGGAGIGNSIHAGIVAIADGTPLGREKLHPVLTTDPRTGVMRHADADYPKSVFARRKESICSI
jgi:urocanate hydratase